MTSSLPKISPLKARRIDKYDLTKKIDEYTPNEISQFVLNKSHSVQDISNQRHRENTNHRVVFSIGKKSPFLILNKIANYKRREHSIMKRNSSMRKLDLLVK